MAVKLIRSFIIPILPKFLVRTWLMDIIKFIRYFKIMHKLNWIFTFSSLSVLFVTIERYSFTTKILLQPYSFMRLHEIVQMIFIILLTVILPFLILKEVSQNFETLKIKRGFLLTLTFLIGVYYYATGNGIHEVSSFNFNHFCDVKNFTGDLCGGFFINDYYTGNIFYFVGGALMVLSILLLEKFKPVNKFSKKDMVIALINAVIYALAIFAYAAFDRVSVGIIYSVIITLISVYLFWKIRKNYLKYPVITYTVTTYTLGTVAALIVRYLI